MTAIPNTTKNAKAFCIECGTELSFHMGKMDTASYYVCNLGACGKEFHNWDEVALAMEIPDGCLFVGAGELVV